MRKCSADVNHIRLHGAVGEAPVYSHLNHGVEFYTFPLVVRRLSGAEDQVNVVAPLELLECCGPLERMKTGWSSPAPYVRHQACGPPPWGGPSVI